MCVTRNKFSVFLKKPGIEVDNMDMYGLYKGAKRLWGSQGGRGKFYKTGGTQYGYAGRYTNILPSRRGRRLRRRARRAFRSANWQWGGFLGVEKKFYDCALSNALVTQNANFTTCMLNPVAIPIANVNCLCAPTQGTGVNQRVGSKYNIVSIQIGGQMTLTAQQNQAAAPPSSTVFWALVMDKQTNGAQMTSELCYQNPSANLAVSSLMPLRNIQYSKRFKVLKTWNTVLLPNFSGDGVANQQDVAGVSYPFEYFKEFKKPIKIETTGNSGTVADIMNISFHMVACANGGGVICSYNCRVRFTDP